MALGADFTYQLFRRRRSAPAAEGHRHARGRHPRVGHRRASARPGRLLPARRRDDRAWLEREPKARRAPRQRASLPHRGVPRWLRARDDRCGGRPAPSAGSTSSSTSSACRLTATRGRRRARARGPAAREVECEVLVVGGGTGGVAAALAAARRGRRVCLVEETDWLGGQLTAQGVSALDEHDLIERFGGTASYDALRQAIRAHYGTLGLDSTPAAATPGHAGCRPSPSSPRSALGAIGGCSPRSSSPGTSASSCERSRSPCSCRRGGRGGDRDRPGAPRSSPRFRPEFVIDATELGDLLPLAGLGYRVGAETTSETGEPHAQPRRAKPRCVQSFTYTFALERTPAGERAPDPTTREVRALPGQPAVQPHDRGARRRDLRRGERLARLPALRARCRARRARSGPTAG